MRTLTRLLLIASSLIPLRAAADSPPACVVAPGVASTAVSPDSVTLDFSLETASDSFEQGTAKARTVEADLESIPAPVDGVTLDASRDMTFLQQRKWSSGTKQTHRFRLAVDHIPEGQAENVTVGIIQSALKKVAGLEVDGYDARLSDARAKQIQTELLKGAIADARDFATTAATEARIKLGAVRSVRIGGGPSLTGAFLNNAESMTVVSRAFSVRDNLASKIRVAVDVTVDYDCERP